MLTHVEPSLTHIFKLGVMGDDGHQGMSSYTNVRNVWGCSMKDKAYAKTYEK